MLEKCKGDGGVARHSPQAAAEGGLNLVEIVSAEIVSRPVGPRVVYFPGNDLGGNSGNTG